MTGTTKLMTAGGGGVNITPASSIASDVTVQVPSQNCTLGIQGPAFSAYMSSAQVLSNATNTKIQFNTKEFDTASCYDAATNYRFTPNVAGYYNVYVLLAGPASGSGVLITSLYKNGSLNKFMSILSNVTASVASGTSTLIYMNGTTDYLEIYGNQNTGGTASVYGGATGGSMFQATLVRAA